MSQTNTTLIAVMAVLLLAACGDSDSSATPPNEPDTQVQGDASVDEDATGESDSASDDAVQVTDAATSEADDAASQADDAASQADDAGPQEDTLTSDASDPQEDVTEPVSDAATPAEDVTDEDSAEEQDTAVTEDVATEPDTAVSEDTGGEDAVVSECEVPCDCAQQGADCIDGACILGIKPVFCCDAEGCIEGEACVAADGADGLCGVATSQAFGVLIINEVLTDGAVDGDPNGDGDAPDPMGDEFVEMVNAGDSDLDISGFQLFDTDMPFVARHTFPEGTSIAPGDAMVVFGGGTAPDDLEHAQFQVANANDPGIPLGLALNNDGDALTVFDADGLHVATFAYGPGAALEAVTDESVARKPDITGEWMGHTWAAGSPDALFSPGTKSDGTSF